MGKVIQAYFGGDCVACIAKRHGGFSEFHVLASITTALRVTIDQVYDDLCPDHKKQVDAALKGMEDVARD
jgi:hypothetical protein